MLVMLALLLVRAFGFLYPSEEPELESSFRFTLENCHCCAPSNIKFWKGDEDTTHKLTPDTQKPPSASAKRKRISGRGDTEWRLIYPLSLPLTPTRLADGLGPGSALHEFFVVIDHPKLMIRPVSCSLSLACAIEQEVGSPALLAAFRAPYLSLRGARGE
jgi:hypothetical protein